MNAVWVYIIILAYSVFINFFYTIYITISLVPCLQFSYVLLLTLNIRMTIRNVSSLKGYQKLNKNKNNWIKYTKYHINKGWFDTGWVYIIILADISFLNTNIYIKYIVLSVRQQEYLLRIFYLDVQSHSTIVYWLTLLPIRVKDLSE